MVEGKQVGSHLIPKSFELAGGAGVQIHELVPVHQQSRLLALVLLLKSQEAPALHLQDTGQVSDVTLKRQKACPDLPVDHTQDKG